MFKNMWGKLVLPYGALDTSAMMQFISDASKKRAQYIEMMAAAFLKETKIPIRHCTLVEKHKADGTIQYYFADKRTL